MFDYNFDIKGILEVYMEFKDYYEILQVHRKASYEIIQKSYKVLALKYHPDRNKDNLKDSEEKMKDINEAYEVLNNPTKREKYNIVYDTYYKIGYDNNIFDKSENENHTTQQAKTYYNNNTHQQSYKNNYSSNHQDQKNKEIPKFRYAQYRKYFYGAVIIIIVIIIIIIASIKGQEDYSEPSLPTSSTYFTINDTNILNESSLNNEVTIQNDQSFINTTDIIEKKEFITIGSTKEDVKKIMGAPDSLMDFTWGYGLSNIEFYGDKVIGWYNIDNNLKISLGSKKKNASLITLGSSQQDVVYAMGTPTSMMGNSWGYGLSSIEFYSGKVIGWYDIDNNLKVSLGNKKKNAPLITVGSSQQDVIDAIGTPTSIMGNTWGYGLSSIEFYENKVTGWYNTEGNLRIK